MEEEQDNKTKMVLQLEEINRHIREGINQWADVCLTADADRWAYMLRYFPRDVMNVTLLFQHVCSSVGIHAGRIDAQKAEEYGKRLRQLVIDMTGFDQHEIAHTESTENTESGDSQ